MANDDAKQYLVSKHYKDGGRARSVMTLAQLRAGELFKIAPMSTITIEEL